MYEKELPIETKGTQFAVPKSRCCSLPAKTITEKVRVLENVTFIFDLDKIDDEVHDLPCPRLQYKVKTNVFHVF